MFHVDSIVSEILLSLKNGRLRIEQMKRNEFSQRVCYSCCRINHEPMETHASAREYIHAYRKFNNRERSRGRVRTHRHYTCIQYVLILVQWSYHTAYGVCYTLSACGLLNGESELREIITIIRNTRGARGTMLITFATCVNK